MSEKPEVFTTIRDKANTKYKEKGSIFLAFAHPINSALQFDELLAGYRKEYYDAVHHCSAYKLIDGNQKYSDDGEPTGSAGIRIMNAIEHKGFNNLAIIVVRYFGGVKLGVGNLGKAYYETSIETLERAEMVTLHKFEKFHFSAPYELSSFLYRGLEGSDVKIISSDYATGLKIEAWIKSEVAHKIASGLYASSNGVLEVLPLNEENYFEV